MQMQFMEQVSPLTVVLPLLFQMTQLLMKWE